MILLYQYQSVVFALNSLIRLKVICITITNFERPHTGNQFCSTSVYRSVIFGPWIVLQTDIMSWNIYKFACLFFFIENRLIFKFRYSGEQLVGFYAISTLIGYLIPNILHTYINIYDFFNVYFVDNISKRVKLICLHTVKWFQVLLCNITLQH